MGRAVGQHQPRRRNQPGQGVVGQRQRCGIGRGGLAAGWVGLALGAHACGLRHPRGAQPRQFLQRRIGPHHARHRIAVSDGNGVQPQLSRARDQFFRVRRAPQKS